MTDELRSEYYYLKEGDIIQEGDEIDTCNDQWRDWPVWKKVSKESIGKPASDPQFVSHCHYRRKI